MAYLFEALAVRAVATMAVVCGSLSNGGGDAATTYGPTWRCGGADVAISPTWAVLCRCWLPPTCTIMRCAMLVLKNATHVPTWSLPCQRFLPHSPSWVLFSI